MPTILVVDDEFDLRFVLRMLLEKRGVDVLEAPEGGPPPWNRSAGPRSGRTWW